jgi:hypothetical protein
MTTTNAATNDWDDTKHIFSSTRRPAPCGREPLDDFSKTCAMSGHIDAMSTVRPLADGSSSVSYCSISFICARRTILARFVSRSSVPRRAHSASIHGRAVSQRPSVVSIAARERSFESNAEECAAKAHPKPNRKLNHFLRFKLALAGLVVDTERDYCRRFFVRQSLQTDAI